MKIFYKTLLTFILTGFLLSVNAQAACCNAGFSPVRVQSIAKNWFRFVMHDSTDADIQSVYWSFGDSTYSNAKTPLHAYYSTGDYPVTLTVIKKTINGIKRTCTETRIISVLYQCSDFTFTPSDLTVSFFRIPANGDSATSGGNNKRFTWTFGDGQFGSGANPMHTYAEAGTYNVCLYQKRPNNPDVIGCSVCHTVIVTDTTPIVCHADFSYALTDSIVFLQGNSKSGDSHWWIEGDTNSNVRGREVQFWVASKDSFVVCHRQYTDSIVGPNSTYCTECNTLRHPVDPLPVCNAAFTYIQTDSLVFLNSESTIGNSYWWIQDDSSADAWGNNSNLLVASRDSFTVCHRKYTDYITAPNSPYCTECKTIFTESIDSVITCNADFTYWLTDSTIVVDALGGAEVSYWTYIVNGNSNDSIYYGEDIAIPIPRNGTIEVCHLQYNASISDSCYTCKVVREQHDTIPSVCHTDFNYTIYGNTITVYADSMQSGNHYWDFSGALFSGDIDSILYTFTSPGIKNICHTIRNEASADSICTTCKEILIAEADVTVNPNPAVNNITVQSNDGLISSISIFNINGIQVKNIYNLSVNTYNVSISDLPGGMYNVLTVLNDGRTKKVKIVVQ